MHFKYLFTKRHEVGTLVAVNCFSKYEDKEKLELNGFINNKITLKNFFSSAKTHWDHAI